MKYVITLLLLACIGSIVTGYFIESEASQKLIGFGTLGLFFVVFPIFIYHRWKDRNFKDYMLTNENLEKMREDQKKKKH